MKSELKINDTLRYEFDDEAEYQGKKFVSFHKESKFKQEVKHQNFTVSEKDWDKVKEWLLGCLEGNGEEEQTPF
jgi:hypothetical protein